MKRGLAVVLIVLMALLLCPDTGRTETAEACPLSVELILPTDNIGTDGYHIAGTPDETVALQAILRNLTGHTITLNFSALNAYTGPEGIFYECPSGVDSDICSLTDESAGLAQYMSMVDTIPLIAGMSAVLTVTVTIPERDAGTLLGGFRVTVGDGEEPVQTIDTAIRIDLPEEEASSVAAGGIEITDQGICIPVVNRTAAVAKNVYAVYEVRDGLGVVTLWGSVSLPEMAPLTTYTIRCPFDSYAGAAGPYSLNVRINADGQEADRVQFPAAVSENEPEAEVLQEISQPSATESEQPVPTGGREPDTAAEGRKEAGPRVTPAVQPLQPAQAAAAAAMVAETDGNLKGFARFVVCAIVAAFVVVLIQKREQTRKKGKHERQPQWFKKGRHAA